MKQFLLFASLCFYTLGFSQLSGDIVIDSRKVVQDISYTMETNSTGTLVYNISVDAKGNVTSCEWNRFESTLNSRRYSYEAKNRILMDLKFEKGNGFPTYHQGKIIITCVVAKE